MLQSIYLKNFKSYREASLPLAPLTLLIGANASGKSNAIEGLRLFSWLAQGSRLTSIQSAVQQYDQVVRGRVQNLGYCEENKFTLGCEVAALPWRNYSLKIYIGLKEDDALHIFQERLERNYEELLYEVIEPAKGMGNDLKVAYNNFARGGNKPRITCSDQFAIFTQLDSAARFNNSHKQSQRTIPSATHLLHETLKNILFLDPQPALMRDYSFKSEKSLQGDGKNLSSVLFYLCGGGKENKRQRTAAEQENQQQILTFIRSLPEQDIDDLDFLIGPRGEVMIKLIETFGGEKRAYDASLLSDGTLRVLAIAAAMLSSPEHGMVVIEEIDNGVHPSRAAQLLAQIAMLAEKRQIRVLLSSHNPALMDALPDAAIPHVVFCYRDPENGSSRLVQLQKIPDYPELLVQGGVGQLMTSGVLERFVKNHPGPAMRRKRALQWLAQLQEVTEEG